MFFCSSPSLYILYSYIFPTPILNHTHPDNRSVASQRACYCIMYFQCVSGLGMMGGLGGHEGWKV